MAGNLDVRYAGGINRPASTAGRGWLLLWRTRGVCRSASRFRYVTGTGRVSLWITDFEAFCQKALQHEVSSCQRNLGDHIEQVGTEPAWTAGLVPEILCARVGKSQDIEDDELLGSQIEPLAGQVVGGTV